MFLKKLQSNFSQQYTASIFKYNSIIDSADKLLWNSE